MGNYELLKAAINEVIKVNGRQEITGEVLNQVLLSMVNSLGAGYQCMGVATPSTNPGTPDQNVFYFATQAGTYTNFDAIVLQAGISVLIWDGEWESQTWFTVDSTPTNNSQNLIASGAVFNALKLDGGAYDVTAHNSGATFASLSALLNSANLNTLIPTEIRHGGMSIKFVQSSDNKYVQYRLMSDTFNTDVAQWQGVDNEPTAGSDNLVKSGGVFNEINQEVYPLKKDLVHNDGNKFPFGISSDGTYLNIRDSRSCNSNCIPIEYNQIYCYGLQSYRYVISFFDQSLNKITDTGWLNNRHIDIEDYVQPSYKFYGITVDEDVMSLENIIIGKNESLPRLNEYKINSRKIDNLSLGKFYILIAEARMRCISINTGILKLRVKNVPLGYNYSVGIADEISQYGAMVDASYDSTWQNTPKYFDLNGYEDKYFTINFKTTAGSSFTNTDVAAIIDGFEFELLTEEDNSIETSISNLENLSKLCLGNYESFFEEGGISAALGGVVTPYDAQAPRLHSMLLKTSECEKIIVNANPSNGHYVALIEFDSKGNLKNDLGWQSSGIVYLPDVISNEYFRLVIDTFVVNPNDCVLTVKKSYKDELINILSNYNRANSKFEVALNNAIIVSDPSEEKMAHAATAQIDENGNVYVGYYCNPETTIESPTLTSTFPKLVVTNIADLQKKVTKIPLRANETITNSDSSTFTQGDYPPYDPNILILNGVVLNYLAVNYNSMAVREFNPTTKEFGNIHQCKLTWKIGGAETEVNLDSTGLIQCASAFGRTYQSFSYTLMMGDRFVYNATDGYYYVAVGSFANIPAFILKTNDGISFKFVCMTPINDDYNNVLYCSEPCIEFYDDNTILFISRKYSAGYTGNIVVGRYKISTDTWELCDKIFNAIDSKPSIVKVNNKLYIVYNCGGNLIDDFGQVPRSKMIFAEIDNNFNQTIIAQFIRTDAIHYPFFVPYKGALYMIYTEDRRKMNINFLRSNISLVKLI